MSRWGMADVRRSCLALACILMAGCGTTASLDQAAGGSAQGPAAAPKSGALESPAAAAAATTPGSSSLFSSGAGPTGSTGGSSAGGRPLTGSTPAGTGDGSTGGPTAAASSPPGAGVGGGPSSPIPIGFQWIDTSSGANGSAAISSKINTGNQVGDAQAVIKWINAHGGMGGHPVQLTIASINYADVFTDPQGQYQQACAALTQDHKLVAVSLMTDEPDLVRCLQQHGEASVSDIYVVGKELYDTSPPLFYTPAQMQYERAVTGMIDAEAAKGFLKGAKVGIFYDTNPDLSSAVAAAKSALAAQNIPVVATYGSSLSTAAQGGQDASTAVLQFRAKGVTHVVFVDIGGGLDYLFMNAAQSQAYTPKYPLSTADNPGALAALAPSAQLQNALGIGWMPVEAESEQSQVEQGWNPTGRLCVQILTAAGEDMTNVSSATTATAVCDQFMFMKAAFDKSREPTASGLAAGVADLGASYQSALTFRTVFGPSRHDGPTATRFLTWQSGCSCWANGGPGPNF